MENAADVVPVATDMVLIATLVVQTETRTGQNTIDIVLIATCVVPTAVCTGKNPTDELPNATVAGKNITLVVQIAA